MFKKNDLEICMISQHNQLVDTALIWHATFTRMFSRNHREYIYSHNTIYVHVQSFIENYE